MTTVGAFDANTDLNSLLKRVSKGEVIRITLRGVPIAKLVPAGPEEEEDPHAVIRSFRDLRKGATLGKISIKELTNEGRRESRR